MHIHIHIHDHRADQYQERILSLLNKIQMTTEEAVAKVNAQRQQLQKIAGEVTAIKDALAEAQQNGDNVPEALAAAIDASGTDIQAIDDMNTDAETAPAEGS